MKKSNRLSINQLSIQQRLTLLICTLLLSAIIIYGFANYYSLKKTILIIGKERLASLTKQIATMLGNNSTVLIKAANKTAADSELVQCLQSNGTRFQKETIDALGKLHRDSTWAAVELLDKELKPLLRSANSTKKIDLDLKSVVSSAKVGPDSTGVGKIYNVKGEMYYPVITAVTDRKQVIGYIVAWIHLKADAKAVVQFSHLVGTGAGFYIVNEDKSLWTDMIVPMSTPPFKLTQTGDILDYSNKAGDRMIGFAEPIQHTQWIVVIDFSEQNVLNGMNSFVTWIIVIGIVLTIIGIVTAWAMSRNITRPLKRLTAAASAISAGGALSPVTIDTNRSDELGELTNAFNTMTAELLHVWQNLDNKVNERTSQLESVNKELEAFSYSVSHDLRAPLRAVHGYSVMLSEDYGEKLDAEGNRIIGNIITNAKMMGQLIDELLAFSRLGKREITNSEIDMQSLSTNVVNELLQNEIEKDYQINIGLLPPVKGDQVLIKQVLINLTSNAMKYSSKKERPEISIGAREEDTRIIYFVKDTGVGFDMAFVGKLFGVFQRLHSQQEFEGTGVGLALVKRIIDKHKGEVWAEAQKDIGATFYFSLPKNPSNER